MSISFQRSHHIRKMQLFWSRGWCGVRRKFSTKIAIFVCYRNGLIPVTCFVFFIHINSCVRILSACVCYVIGYGSVWSCNFFVCLFVWLDCTMYAICCCRMLLLVLSACYSAATSVVIFMTDTFCFKAKVTQKLSQIRAPLSIGYLITYNKTLQWRKRLFCLM